MRNRLIFLATAALCLVLYHPAALAQDTQNPRQPPPRAASAQTQQQQPVADDSDQPVSLADLARATRAKKQSGANQPAAKSAKLLDDDNMPRGAYGAEHSSADNPGRGGSTPRTAGGSPQDQYRGKVVLLDFWASWCGPCRSALPSLKRLQAVYGGADFVVISISEDDGQSDWRAFVSSHQMTWPQRLDSTGALQKQFGVAALPTYVLIGRDGAVIQTFVGEEIAESLPERIGPDLKAALAAKP